VCVVTAGHQCTLPCPAQHHPPLLRVVDHHSGWSEPDARYDDGNRLRGKTVWVEGYGRGVVKYFKKLSGRPSVHTVEFQAAHAETPPVEPSPYSPSGPQVQAAPHFDWRLPTSSHRPVRSCALSTAVPARAPADR
jgi:hypothetical protein